MAIISRTIYTRGQVLIQSGSNDGNWSIVSGVQSASVSYSSPNQTVNSFGTRGIIANVQLEPETASTTFSFILPTATGNSSHISPSMINELMTNSVLDAPVPMHVTVAGVGKVISGYLSSISVNAAVGDLATCEMTFEGVPSGGIAGNDSDGERPDPVTSVAAVSYPVLTPDRVSGIGPAVAEDGSPVSNAIGGFGAAAQSASFSWEIPVERVMSLGDLTSNATSFTNPPGTSSMTVEGMDLPLGITGLVVGGYTFGIGTQGKVTAREHNLAVGDVGATFNVTVSSTADACTCVATPTN
jgi:hypothetical protein